MTQPDHSKPYATAGEWVTCENGHRICQVARDLHCGMLQDPPNDFKDWQQPEPALGSTNVEPCRVCGAKWFRAGLAAVGEPLAVIDPTVFHFEDGWR